MKTKNILKTTAILTLSIFITFNVFASESAKKPEDVIKSCIDDQTFAVIHVNLEKVNINAFIDIALEIINKQAGPEIAKNLEGDLKSFQTQAQVQMNELMKAGGKDFFVVFSMYDFPYFFVAAPLGNNQAGLSQQIQKITKDFNIGKLDLYSNDELILVGLEQTITRLKTISPIQSGLLAKGFQACGDTTVQAALFPSSDQRKIMAEMLPQIPFGSGAINFTTIGRDLQWAALGLNGPPSISLNFTIQSQSSESADNLLTFIRNLYSFAEQNPEVQELKPQLNQLLKLLTPEKKENQLVLKVESKTANSIIDDIIAPSVFKARAAAARMTCASHLKQIGIALTLYANDYGDKYPPNLKILTSEAELSPKILACPAAMNQNSYIYRGEGISTSDIPGLILVFDKKSNHEGGRNVLFLDGHVEFVTEEHFLELINEDNKYRKQKGYREIPAEK
ncbi:MAG: DUF1559 domain-containing protein [Sedimentisphaerales bacterium]|nr:DUF1559 domain-containing protein [Sedimentisphaerales bacterium]